MKNFELKFCELLAIYNNFICQRLHNILYDCKFTIKHILYRCAIISLYFHQEIMYKS